MDNLFAADQPDTNLNNDRDEILAKWKDKPIEELLEAKINSDLYIKTLEKQKDELRQEYLQSQADLQARTNLSDLIDRINRQATPPTTQPTEVKEKPAEIDTKSIEDLVLRKIEDTKLRDSETRNFNTVQSKLRERYGNNTAVILEQQSNTLGLSKDYVNDLARKSPEAFFRIMGLNDQNKEQFQTPPRSDLRNDHFSPRVQKRTYSFYQDMKRKEPSKYWDPKTQVQMHKDGEALGADFFDDGQPIIYSP